MHSNCEHLSTYLAINSDWTGIFKCLSSNPSEQCSVRGNVLKKRALIQIITGILIFFLCCVITKLIIFQHTLNKFDTVNQL